MRFKSKAQNRIFLLAHGQLNNNINNEFSLRIWNYNCLCNQGYLSHVGAEQNAKGYKIFTLNKKRNLSKIALFSLYQMSS